MYAFVFHVVPYALFNGNSITCLTKLLLGFLQRRNNSLEIVLPSELVIIVCRALYSSSWANLTSKNHECRVRKATADRVGGTQAMTANQVGKTQDHSK